MAVAPVPVSLPSKWPFASNATSLANGLKSENLHSYLGVSLSAEEIKGNLS